jgi:hypothetical protein
MTYLDCLFFVTLCSDVTRLEANLLEGTIPDELFNARKMSTLYLHNNNLVGTLSTNVEQMVDLQQLTVKFNSLTGAIPTEFESLEKLCKYLTLSIHKNMSCLSRL